jgi:hypothetical protein
MGARSAGNPHAACDVEGAGNVARSRRLPARQSSTLPMSGDGKRSVAEWSKLPRPSSTLPSRQLAACNDRVASGEKRTRMDFYEYAA